MATARRFSGVAVVAAALALLAAAPSAGAAQHPGVLVVGDSLEELTSPYLAKFLPGVKLTVNAVGGYNSFQILELFEESYDPSQSVIVFDAGTNDNPSYPQILAENLSKVAATIGNRCMVVPTIHGLHPGGVDDSGKNRVVAEFAASRPGTQTPDWAGAVAQHPELMQADNLHPIAAGAELRARLIAQGVEACLAGEGAQTSRRGPVLKSKPERLPPAKRIAKRQEELLAAIASEVIDQTAARESRGRPLFAALVWLWGREAGD
ncbi:MAG TPA: hypothetical protein VHU86_11090 [Solirubrobacterales bacterium]|jgi:hypothetical protein|nr:hypothetical protein [Solirubrobacterales bacterium]